ncbi:hypothetical protein DSO57_1017495 [Entomophthora muscae]|uniref:Uncharacterized protein n=1 Tax=Entomophthora muscae TaxID=34485 RepID=A0ACC2TT24_9FUNG|nr:hypothetical protein DSO57_1017495 [Entomophthora muscae]
MLKEHLTIFIILRKDLVKSLGWTSGSIIAQACHASTAVLHQHSSLPSTKEYLENLEQMHKVVLETKNENSLLAVANNLTELGIPHCCWIENPENIKTCIATAPVLRSDLKDALKKCSLYRQ